MAKEPMKSLTLYYCYAREDKPLREELEKHLSPLKLQGQITTWHDGEIKAGTEWQREITHYLQSADVILLLVSPDFFTLEGIYLESMKQAFVRHEREEALVIPILLRPVDIVGTTMSNLKALPENGVPVTSWHNHDEAFLDIAKGIRHAVTLWLEHKSSSNVAASPVVHGDNRVVGGEREAIKGIYQVVQSVFLFNESLSNPEEFYGRRRERAKLMDRTYKGSATSIVGPRRIGKTWLMQYMKLVALTQFGSRFRVAYIDATSPRCATVAGFVSVALEELGVHTTQHPEVTMDLAYMERAVKDMRERRLTPVLCIDEFEGLANEDIFELRFFTGLRAIAQSGLVLVVASKHSLIDLVSSTLKTSPFFNIFEKLSLGPFSPKEAEEFVHIKSDQAGFNQQEHNRLLHYGRTWDQSWLPARLDDAGIIYWASLLAGYFAIFSILINFFIHSK